MLNSSTKDLKAKGKYIKNSEAPQNVKDFLVPGYANTRKQPIFSL